MSALDGLLNTILTDEEAQEFPTLIEFAQNAKAELAALRAELDKAQTENAAWEITANWYKAQLDEANENLLSVVEQYCFRQAKGKEFYSHDFMSAGEGAFEYLTDNGLAEWCENGVDICNLKFPSAKQVGDA